MKLVNESLYDFLAEEVLNEKFDLNTVENLAKKAAIIKISPIVTKMAENPKLSKKDIVNKLSSIDFIKNYVINPIEFKDATSLYISQKGINFIKHHEKLMLTAYNIGDGKITIGYGHAEPESTSQFKEGQIISKSFADNLFIKDLKNAEEGVRRLFIKWESMGLDIKVTQSMWDSMVSMAFNMGVNGLRGSEIVQALKQEDYFTAAELIPHTKISDNFPGLQKRREKEKEMFLADVI